MSLFYAITVRKIKLVGGPQLCEDSRVRERLTGGCTNRHFLLTCPCVDWLVYGSAQVNAVLSSILSPEPLSYYLQ